MCIGIATRGYRRGREGAFREHATVALPSGRRDALRGVQGAYDFGTRHNARKMSVCSGSQPPRSGVFVFTCQRAVPEIALGHGSVVPPPFRKSGGKMGGF